jgi:hypothetical protein
MNTNNDSSMGGDLSANGQRMEIDWYGLLMHSIAICEDAQAELSEGNFNKAEKFLKIGINTAKAALKGIEGGQN